MLAILYVLGALPLGVLSSSIPATSYKATCRAIDAVLSKASAVFYPGSPEYTKGNLHWEPTPIINSTCVVEPGSAADVSRILRVLGSTTTPFGIKSGGHSNIPGFAGSEGVQIALSRLNQTVYNRHTQTVDIGPGQPWDSVYTVLDKLGITVAGGRISGVGVGGYVLGGGYSWISNSAGLAIDNILEFELVLPNGRIVIVNEKSQPDLFFGLTGGFNNYGIMTRVTMKALRLGQVWGGLIRYSGASATLASNAVLNYYEKTTDTQASLLAAYQHFNGEVEVEITLFYNASSPAPGVFDEFLSIPPLSKDLAARNLADFVVAVSKSYGGDFTRAALGALTMTGITEGILQQTLNITAYWDDPVRFAPGGTILVTIEPFLKAPITVANYQRTGYPHFKFGLPTNVFFTWPNTTYDDKGFGGVKNVISVLTDQAKRDGQDLTNVPVYSNYALSDQPLEDLYNVNLPRLKAIRKKFDPKGVMLRAGGFKLV